MYLIVEDNPNSTADERVFSTTGDARRIRRVQLTPPGLHDAVWCDVAAVTEAGAFDEAHAQRVEDSSDGTAWLVFGGPWGIRLRIGTSGAEWSINNKDQWGLPFLVLDSSGTSIDFY